MSLKRPTTMFVFFLLSVSILSGFAFQDSAYAESGMEVSVNAAEGSTTISVSGHTSIGNNSVQVVVTAPNGNIVSIDQLMPDTNGDFMTDIQVGGSQWKQDGMYTISVQQGTGSIYSFKLLVEVNGGTTAATSVSESTLKSGVPSGIVITPGKEISGLTITSTTTESL